jgi:hypothetical protein
MKETQSMQKKDLMKGLLVLVLITALLAACNALSAGPVSPEPGVTHSGTISMDKAQTARISLQVSDDGQAIESVNVAFTDLKCEGFSAGSTSSTAGTQTPIVDGKFEIKSSNIGSISGQFKSPTSVEGSIQLAFFEGKAECGTWEWSAIGE